MSFRQALCTSGYLPLANIGMGRKESVRVPRWFPRALLAPTSRTDPRPPPGSAPQRSPLPGAEVDDEKPVIFVGVNVMEEVEGRGAVFDVEEPAFLLLCHVKPDLKSKAAAWRRLRETKVKPIRWASQPGAGCPVQPRLVRPAAYPHGFVGLEAVHVVGSPKAPGGEELEEVDFHRRFDKHYVVRGQPKAVRKRTGSTSSSLQLLRTKTCVAARLITEYSTQIVA